MRVGDDCSLRVIYELQVVYSHLITLCLIFDLKEVLDHQVLSLAWLDYHFLSMLVGSSPCIQWLSDTSIH